MSLCELEFFFVCLFVFLQNDHRQPVGIQTCNVSCLCFQSSLVGVILLFFSVTPLSFGILCHLRLFKDNI